MSEPFEAPSDGGRMATKRTTSTLAGIAARRRRSSASPGPPRAISPPLQHSFSTSRTSESEYEEEGYAAAKARHQEPDAIEAAFPLESYRPGATAVAADLDADTRRVRSASSTSAPSPS